MIAQQAPKTDMSGDVSRPVSTIPQARSPPPLLLIEQGQVVFAWLDGGERQDSKIHSVASVAATLQALSKRSAPHRRAGRALGRFRHRSLVTLAAAFRLAVRPSRQAAV